MLQVGQQSRLSYFAYIFRQGRGEVYAIRLISEWPHSSFVIKYEQVTTIVAIIAIWYL